MVIGLNQSRGAAISATMPAPSSFLLSSLVSLRICPSVLPSISGTASSSWNIIASKPSFLSCASFQSNGLGGRVIGP